jgi:uroporphyrinogen-III decarboxylase
MPIGADLVLHEQPDADRIKRDGRRLGGVLEAAARRFRTPLAFPLMDLTLEKTDLLAQLGVAEHQAEAYQFSEAPDTGEIDPRAPFPARNQAHIESIRYIAERPSLVPVGMAIGPFSLMTRLVRDPITPVAMSGLGASAEDDAGVRLVERCLVLAEKAVARSLHAQIAAGAKAILICEPAASVVFLSPKQISAGSDIFERFVIQPHLRLKALLDAAGVDLIFHDCGELTSAMVRDFAVRLDPAILSLGSSRRLWEDAAQIPERVVLFGNLPTKSFYSDAVMPDEKVESLTRELLERMRTTGHPFILGSECDVLHVPGSAETIRRKVNLMLRVV